MVLVFDPALSPGTRAEHWPSILRGARKGGMHVALRLLELFEREHSHRCFCGNGVGIGIVWVAVASGLDISVDARWLSATPQKFWQSRPATRLHLGASKPHS